MFVIKIKLGAEVLSNSATQKNWRAIIIAHLSVIIFFERQIINSAYIVLGGAVLEYLLYLRSQGFFEN